MSSRDTRIHPLLFAAAGLAATACLEVPELEPFVTPPPDLGTAETWPEIGTDGGGGSGAEPSDAGSSPKDAGGDTGSGEPSADPALAQLRISEVCADPEGKDGGVDSPEFVELFNPGPEHVELTGLIIDGESWPILDGAELGLAGTTLPVGAVLVVRRFATDVDPSLAEVGVAPELIEVGFLHGSGLRNADGVVTVGSSTELADAFVYGAIPDPAVDGWIGGPAAVPESGQTACRMDPTTDTDDSTDWTSCWPSPGTAEDQASGDTGTSGASGDDADGTDEGDTDGAPDPLPIAPKALAITEVHANPPGLSSEEKLYEFIELINLSENELELAGCTISDAAPLDAPGTDPLLYREGDGGCATPTCLAPGHRALIVGNQYMGPTGDALVLETDDSTLADGGLTMTEPAVLRDAFGTLITSYRLWPAPESPPIPTDELPLHRLSADAADEASSWISADPTPGF